VLGYPLQRKRGPRKKVGTTQGSVNSTQEAWTTHRNCEPRTGIVNHINFSVLECSISIHMWNGWMDGWLFVKVIWYIESTIDMPQFTSSINQPTNRHCRLAFPSSSLKYFQSPLELIKVVIPNQNICPGGRNSLKGKERKR